MRNRLLSQSTSLTITSQRLKVVMGDMTQAEFANEVHTSQTTISKVLSGATPSSALLVSISQRFGVSTDWLLGLSDNKYVSGASTERLLYSDVVPVLAGLLDKGSVTYKTDIEKQVLPINEDGTAFNTEKYTIHILEVNDSILQNCISLFSKSKSIGEDAHSLMIKAIKENYRHEVLRWSSDYALNFDSYVYQHNREPDMLVNWLKSLDEEEARARRNLRPTFQGFASEDDEDELPF